MSLARFIVAMNELYFPGKHPSFPDYQFSATPTLAKAGSGESIVPDEASVLYDIRLLPIHSKKEIVQKVEELAKAQKSKHGYTLAIKTDVPAVLSDVNALFIQKVRALHQEMLGTEPELKGSGPANESYMLIQREIPTVAGYGLIGAGFHANNEYAELKSLQTSFNFLLKLAQKI